MVEEEIDYMIYLYIYYFFYLNLFKLVLIYYYWIVNEWLNEIYLKDDFKLYYCVISE